MSDAASMRDDGPTDGELIARINDGGEAAKAALIQRHMPLLLAMAGRLAQDAAQRAELVQAGCIGLMLAARQYDAEHGAKFITYAVPWILGEMKQARAKMMDAMGARSRRRTLAACEAEFRRREGRSPRLNELAKLCGMSEFDAASALCAVQVSLEEEREDGASLASMIAGGEEIDVEALDLRTALEKLPQDERQLVFLRYYRDKTQTEAAALMGKSQTQISRIERRALDRLHCLLA